MPKVSDIRAVTISLETGGKTALFILLAADGSINRMGTGAVNNKDKDLFIGVTKKTLFDQLMACLDDGMLKHTGGYDVPERRGVTCKLSIGFSFTNGKEDGFGFRYGAESSGPPGEIAQFVMKAVELTDPWFEKQKQMVKGAGPKRKKPWWKFW
jgi:hypothetical protein